MHILFAGCGAVTTVMIQQLTYIADTYSLNLQYTIMTRSTKVTSELDQLGVEYQLILEPDFSHFFGQTKIYDGHIDRVINTATPELNNIILSWAVINRCHYMDLASELATDDIVAGHVQQFKFDQQCKELGLTAIVNAGVSPGLTEILIAYVIQTYQINPIDIHIYLDENFNCLKPLFSRSPRVAIQELLTPPVWIQDSMLMTGAVFSNTELRSSGEKCKDYIRITQEEIMSIRSKYPRIANLQMFAGGSEIEHIRFIYNLGILQDQIMLDRLMSQMPSAATRADITDAYRKGLIDDAGFQATIQIADGSQSKLITITFDWQTFQSIQETAYAGATSIGYPTGISSAWIRYMAHISHDLHGVISCLDLGYQLDSLVTSQVILALQSQGLQIDIV